MALPSSFLNQYFDHIYVLNLRRRVDRRIEMNNKLNYLGIKAEFVEAVDGYSPLPLLEYEIFASQPIGGKGSHPLEYHRKRKAIENAGAWGCLKSYLGMIEDAKNRGFQRILCLEDDAVFHRDFENRFQQAISVIPPDWKLLYLGATQRFWEVPIGLAYPDKSKIEFDPLAAYYLPKKTNGSFSIGLHASIFDLLIQEILKMNCAFDSGPLRAVSEAYPEASIVLYPNLIIADVTDTDIRGKRDQQALAEKVRWNLSDYDFQFQLKNRELPTSNNLPIMKKLEYRQHRNILLEGYKTIFFILSKNGCSSIKSQLLEPLGMEDKSEDLSQDIHRPDLYPFPFAPHDELKTTYNDYIKFTIVRNPWSRLVSCFKDKIRPATYNEAGYKDGVAMPLQRFDVFYGGMSFEAFVDAVCEIPDAVADHHFRSQVYQLIDDEAELVVNYIGRLETLEVSLQEISQKTGLEFSAHFHINKTSQKPYQAYYTEELKAKVQKRFSTDIAFLGYTFEGQEGLPTIGMIDDAWRAHFSQKNLLNHILKEKNRELGAEVNSLNRENEKLAQLRQKVDGRNKKMAETIQQLKKTNQNLRARLAKAIESQIKPLTQQLAHEKTENEKIKKSLSWRITGPLRKIGSLFSLRRND